METINQPTALPTNKLTAATVGVVVCEVLRVVVSNFWPEWGDTVMWSSLTPVAVFALGYLIKDAPNAGAA